MFALPAFIRDLRRMDTALWLALILFLLGGVTGWLGTGSIERLLAGQLEGLSKISGELRDSSHPQWSFFWFIFMNNSIKCVAVIYLGALFGVLPAVFLLINGAVIGYVIHLSLQQGQDLFELIVKGLLPHGIVEIPALLIACAIGLQFGREVIRQMSGTAGRPLSHLLRQTVTGAFWVVVLMFIAALIESTITFALLS
ncbi:stage II sporulation protein M [Paenibacillus tepidiphilus]|uniref:stage II sporulation protein M n=1 Tax=Paenibacillus tepidiphilus TaxID=2608683 RepID=UPI00123A2CE3|nr:stage II sporulation protein M [Paenibacillus tepidiphilus]